MTKHRFNRVALTSVVGGKADVRQNAQNEVNDLSRKQGVHRNNRRTCRVFAEYSGDALVANMQHKATYLLGCSLSVGARQETDMPLVAFPA